MKVEIVELLEGAKRARGLVVIIDVFRAFSLECYLMAAGTKKILPIGDLQLALQLKEKHPDYILIGERNGAQVKGCDYGNSPSQLGEVNLQGKTVIHTTSAGTQGIASAIYAKEIITGSLVNAKAIAEYIKATQPPEVYLVAMGNAGKTRAMEDVVCARYLKSLIEGTSYPILEEVRKLKTHGGEHFFNPETQVKYPQADFDMCTRVDCFSMVLQVHNVAGCNEVMLQN